MHTTLIDGPYSTPGTKNPRSPNGRGKRVFIPQRTESAKARADGPSSRRRQSRSSGLPFLPTFRPSRKTPVAHEEKRSIQAYGGVSALALNEIPYQAPKGTLRNETFANLSGKVKGRNLILTKSNNCCCFAATRSSSRKREEKILPRPLTAGRHCKIMPPGITGPRGSVPFAEFGAKPRPSKPDPSCSPESQHQKWPAGCPNHPCCSCSRCCPARHPDASQFCRFPEVNPGRFCQPSRSSCLLHA